MFQERSIEHASNEDIEAPLDTKNIDSRWLVPEPTFGSVSCAYPLLDLYSDTDGASRDSHSTLHPERLINPLTHRELELLQLMCEGLSNLEISKRLNLAVGTVKFHFVNAFGKLGVQRRTQAVAVVVYLGLVEPSWMSSTRLAIGAHARTKTRVQRP